MKGANQTFNSPVYHEVGLPLPKIYTIPQYIYHFLASKVLVFFSLIDNNQGWSQDENWEGAKMCWNFFLPEMCVGTNG